MAMFRRKECVKVMSRSFAGYFPSPAFDCYWQFAFERQEVYFARIAGLPYPWTDDPIIRNYRFTNVFRISDRVSQYLLTDVVYDCCNRDPDDTCFRILLFKLFNKIETWEYLREELGDICWNTFSVDLYDSLLIKRQRSGAPIYSSAYIMPAANGARGKWSKHRSHLLLIERMMKDQLASRIAAAQSLKQVYEALNRYKGLGPFLSYQYAIDINYSNLCDFDENDFVVPGPGAMSGIKKCFPGADRAAFSDIIMSVVQRQREEFENRGLRFRNLYGRDLHAIDCQNLFCEIDKYTRLIMPELEGVGNRFRIKRRYQMSARGAGISEPFLPPKWGMRGASDSAASFF